MDDHFEDFAKLIALDRYGSDAQFGIACAAWFACEKIKNSEIDRLRTAIRKTLDENGHLADGEDCALIELKRAIGYE